jgi:type II secretory pathway pseudopilin PulG
MSLKALRGTTLVELLIALLLLALVGGIASGLLINQRRNTSELLASDLARRTADQASGWMSTELAEVGRTDANTDLWRLGRDSLTYRAWRLAGLACRVTGTEVRIPRSRLSMWRAPQPGRDSLSLFLASDTLPGNGSWQVFPILSVGESTCPEGRALALGTRIEFAPLNGLPPLTPVRTFEVMQLRLYHSLGQWWLGARSESAGEGIQPLAGPLEERGLEVRYRDPSGNEVRSPELVVQLDLVIVPAGGRDSARILVQPRNLR